MLSDEGKLKHINRIKGMMRGIVVEGREERMRRCFKLFTCRRDKFGLG